MPRKASGTLQLPSSDSFCVSPPLLYSLCICATSRDDFPGQKAASAFRFPARFFNVRPHPPPPPGLSLYVVFCLTVSFSFPLLGHGPYHVVLCCAGERTVVRRRFGRASEDAPRPRRPACGGRRDPHENGKLNNACERRFPCCFPTPQNFLLCSLARYHAHAPTVAALVGQPWKANLGRTNTRCNTCCISPARALHATARFKRRCIFYGVSTWCGVVWYEVQVRVREWRVFGQF